MELGGSRWLLTGAAGRIGSRLRPVLAARVGELVIADLVAPADPRERERAIACDVTDPEAVAAAVAGCDGVVHLAGIADEAPYPDLLRVNVLGTYHVLEAMRRAGVRRLVYASSNRATGCHDVTTTLDDASTVRPDGLYGASKAAVEALARMYSDKFGLQVCLMRIGTFEAGPSTPRDAATWLSHADAARAFLAAMSQDEPFSLFYAVSANTHGFWSLEPGRRIGFEPQDDAARILGADVRPEPGPQAGDKASAEFTLPYLG